MNDLTIYRYNIGSYYGRASYKSSVRRLSKHVFPSPSCWPFKQRKWKRKQCKLFSGHRIKYQRPRYRLTHSLFQLLPVLIILLFTTLIYQYDTSPAENNRMLSQMEIPAYSLENSSQKTKDIPVSLIGKELFTNNDKNTSYIYYHTSMYSKYNEYKKDLDLYRELYIGRMFITQYIFSDSPFVSYPWQREDDIDLEGSTNMTTRNHIAALPSNYECGRHGSGTCYYLLGNKGMHMSNGNPQTKLLPGEARLTKQSLSLIKNRTEESVGYINVDGGLGTGFRVCDTYLMSAFHVFSDKIDDLVNQIIFPLSTEDDIPKDVVLSKVKDSLEVVINEDGPEDFGSKARCMLMSFLEHTAYDTENLVARLKDIIDTDDLITIFKKKCKNCFVDFISHGRFNIDWKIIFGNKDIDIIIVDLYPTQRYQDYPIGMLLDEKYRKHGGIQLVRYIHRNPPEIIIDQRCKVFRSDNKLQEAVEKATKWWKKTFPDHNETTFTDGYKDCCQAIDKTTGRVILKSSESFIEGSSGSPVIYMLNKDGVPIVEMIYQGGYPPFYYTSEAQHFHDATIDRKCFFGRATVMKKLSESLDELKKIELKRLLFSSECLHDSKGIRRDDAMTENVIAWEEADTCFYETKVSKVILNRISDDEYHSVSVIGVPGSGKTAAIRHAALHLQNEKGFTVYPIIEPKTFAEKFNMYFSRDRKQVFVFDDPVGCYNIDMKLLKLWDDHNENIENCLNVKTKFLFSLRTQIEQHTHLKYNSYVFNMKARVIDLMSPTFALNMDDMKGMLRYVLKTKEFPFRENTLSNIAIDHNDTISRCFPLLCKVFCEEQALRKNPSQFFKNPFPALIQIFQRIKSHNKHQFCGLLMCAVLEDRSVGSSLFTCDNVDLDTKLLRNAVLLELKLTENDLKYVHRELEASNNVFVKYIGSNIKFVHSIFKDIVIFLNNNPDFVFKYGSSQLITERVRIDNPLPDDDQFVLVYQSDEYLTILADRLIQDFLKDPTFGFSFIANNYMIHDDRVFAYIENKLFSTHPFLEKMNENRFFLHESVSSGNTKLTQYLLENLRNISDPKLILHSACRAPSNNLELIVLLVKHGALLNQLTSNSESVLHYVTRYTNNSNVEISEYFLQKGISVHTLNSQKESLLHYTAKYGGRDVKKLAKLFIQHGANLNIKTVKGKSILHYIVSYETEDNVKLAELFICRGASVDVVDREGRSLLHHTARYNTENNRRLAKLFIRYGASLNVADKEGQSALHFTARYKGEKNVKLAELFIHHGASVNSVDKDGLSLLHYASRYKTENNVKLSELAIHDGASVNVVDQEGRSLLHYTARYKIENIVKLAELFIQHGAELNVVDKKGQSLLHYTVCYEDENSVKLAELFIQHGASVFVVDEQGLSLLHYTVLYNTENSLKLAELFIKYRAQVNVVDKVGRTLLHYTVCYENENCVNQAQLFIKHGASVNVVDKEGQSLLHYTISYEGENSVKLAELFIQNGISVNCMDKEEHSILHYTARYNTENNVQLAELFIEHGAIVNVVDEEGQSVLHYTARFNTENNVILAEMFLHHGASVNVMDKEERSLLHYTARYNTENNVMLAKLFICRGALVNVMDNEGQSLLYYTARYNTENNVKLAELFIDHEASVNCVDLEGQSLLHSAVRYNIEDNVTLAKLFLHNGVSVNCVDKEGLPLLHYTVRSNTESKVKLAKLFIHYGALVNAVDKEGQSLLHYAVRYYSENNRKLAEILIKLGVSVNAVDIKRQSLLHYTARYTTNKRLELALLFMFHGASVNVVDKEKQTLLHYTTRFNTEKSAQLAKLFINHGASVNDVDKEEQSLLHYTARYGGKNNVTLAQLFIDYEASVNAEDNEGQSALHYIIRYKGENNIKLAELFIQHAASVNVVDKEGRSLLHYTARYKDENIVKLAELVIHHGASVNVIDNEGRSSLHYCLLYEGKCAVELAELFVKHEAFVNAVNKKGQSLLHYTARYFTENNRKLAKLFIQSGASVNVADNKRQSLLHYTARFTTKNRLDLALLFMDHGASVNVVDEEEQTLLHYTTRFNTKNSEKLAERFIHLGASVNVVDKNRQSLLHYAAYYTTENRIKLAKLFIQHGSSVNVVDNDGWSLLHYTRYYNTINSVNLAELFLHHGASANVVDEEEQF